MTNTNLLKSSGYYVIINLVTVKGLKVEVFIGSDILDLAGRLRFDPTRRDCIMFTDEDQAGQEVRHRNSVQHLVNFQN